MTALTSATAARERADLIRLGMDEIAPLVQQAWEQHDWLALGYSSWNEYVVGEFGGPLRLGREERKVAVIAMREAGMSTRAIGSALGVSAMTALRDSGVTNVTEEELSTIPDAPTWPDLVRLMEEVSDFLISDPALVAESVPERRKATTAKKLRRLGSGLGLIAWNLEGKDFEK